MANFKVEYQYEHRGINKIKTLFVSAEDHKEAEAKAIEGHRKSHLYADSTINWVRIYPLD